MISIQKVSRSSKKKERAARGIGSNTMQNEIRSNLSRVSCEEFSVQVDVHQGSVLSSLLFSKLAEIIFENAREGLMNEILYASDLVLMSDSIENLKKKCLKWKEAFESKGLMVNLKKTK